MGGGARMGGAAAGGRGPPGGLPLPAPRYLRAQFGQSLRGELPWPESSFRESPAGEATRCGDAGPPAGRVRGASVPGASARSERGEDVLRGVRGGCPGRRRGETARGGSDRRVCGESARAEEVRGGCSGRVCWASARGGRDRRLCGEDVLEGGRSSLAPPLGCPGSARILGPPGA